LPITARPVAVDRAPSSTHSASGSWRSEGESIDAVTATLLGDLARYTRYATHPDTTVPGAAGLPGAALAGGAVPDAVRIDRIAALERIRAALAAVQHVEMVAFARSQVEAQSLTVPPRGTRRGR